MKRTIKNDKVLRAITIGLATMIAATSMPITTFAAEEGEEGEAGESSSGSTDTDVSEADDVCEEAANESGDAENHEGEAQDLINDASEAVEAISDFEAAFDNSGLEVPAEPAAEQPAPTSQDDPAPVNPDPTNPSPAPTVNYDENTIQQNLTGALEAVQQINNDLTTPVGQLEGTEDNKSVKEHLVAAATLAGQGDDIVSDANKEVAKVNEQIEAFNSADTAATAAAGSASLNAYTANDIKSSEKEAKEAASQAQSDLNSAKSNLDTATQKLEAAKQAVDAAFEAKEKAAKDAEEKYNEAQSELDATKKQLGNAEINATAAQERMKAAEAKVKALKADAEAHKEEAKELKAIQEQYYAFMVYYLSTDNKSYVFGKDKDENGNEIDVLDVAETAKKWTESQVNARAIQNKNEMFALGRNVTRLLVEHLINGYEDVDPESANIVFGAELDNTKSKPADIKAGEVDVDVSSKKCLVSLSSLTDEDGKKLFKNDKLKWYTPDQNNVNGRSNYVIVTYKDKKNNPQVKRFNYVFKNSNITYADGTKEKTDIENGAFYLAEIGTDGTITRVIDNNNFDNYSRLTEMLDAIDNLKKYEDAVNAVVAAREKVDALKAKIDSLQNIVIDRTSIDNLNKAYQAALDDYNTASGEKTKLENLVKKAEEDVKSINLSRFDKKENEPPKDPGTPLVTPPVTPANEAGTTGTTDAVTADDDDDDDDAADVATGEGFTYDLGSASTSIPTYDISSTGAPVDAAAFDDAGTFGDAGVLGARVPEGGSTGGDANGAGLENNGGIAPVANFNTVKKVLGAKTPVVGKKNNKKGVRVADPVTPLAAMPEEDGFSMNWWWLLVIALLGATGKKMYDEHKKKVEAREQARNNIND